MIRTGSRTGFVRQKGNPRFLDALVFMLLVFAMLTVGVYAAAKDLVDKGTFLANTQVNGVDVSGLTPEEAVDKLLAVEQQKYEKTHIEVTCADQKRVFTPQDAGLTSGAEQAFQSALTLLGKDASIWQRMAELYRLREGVEVDVSVAYSKPVLVRAVAAFAKPFFTEALDAEATFDFETETFSYVHDRPQTHLDEAALVDQLLHQFQAGDTTPIQASLVQVPAQHTLDILKRNTRLIGYCITELTDNADRTRNVELITQAVNGTVLLPGENCSINEMTGRRTQEKGYRPAKAIVQGQYVYEYGGGVCQLSGTLYNAALLAGAQIVQRVAHTIPSSYLPLGLDATIDFDSQKDLVFQNVSPYPMYIVAHIQGMELVVRIYGGYPQEDLRYEVRTETISTIKPNQPVMIYDATLPKGQRVLVSPARDGYEVKSYRDVYKAGDLIETQLLASDYFAPKPVTYREGTKVVHSQNEQDEVKDD